MGKIVLGKSGAIEQPKKYSGGPLKPGITVRSWKGPKAAVLAMLQDPSLLAWDWSIEETGPNATLTAQSNTLPGSDETGTVLTDVWELRSAEVEKDILEADIAGIAGIPAATKQKIRHLIDTRDESTVIEQTFGTPGIEPAVTALKVYNLMVKGVKSVRVYAPILTRRITVSSKYSTAVPMANVGRVLKSTTMVQSAGNGESVPATFLIPLNSAPFTSVSADATLAYGWLKGYPALVASAGGRTELTQEFQFGLWSVLLYGVAL